MIGPDECQRSRNGDRRAMFESGLWPEDRPSSRKKPEVGIEGDAPEREDDSNTRQCGHFRFEVGKAFQDLFGRRLVAGRRTPHGGGDEGVMEPQTIVCGSGGGDVGEAGAMHGSHQKITRPADTVASEDAAGAVGAVSSGRQTDNQQSRARIAEPRHRPRPVRLGIEGAPLFTSDAATVLAQAWAALTRDDGVVDQGERLHIAERARLE